MDDLRYLDEDDDEFAIVDEISNPNLSYPTNNNFDIVSSTKLPEVSTYNWVAKGSPDRRVHFENDYHSEQPSKEPTYASSEDSTEFEDENDGLPNSENVPDDHLGSEKESKVFAMCVTIKNNAVPQGLLKRYETDVDEAFLMDLENDQTMTLLPDVVPSDSTAVNEAEPLKMVPDDASVDPIKVDQTNDHLVDVFEEPEPTIRSSTGQLLDHLNIQSSSTTEDSSHPFQVIQDGDEEFNTGDANDVADFFNAQNSSTTTIPNRAGNSYTATDLDITIESGSPLNLEANKQRVQLRQKGSLANRKKPSRSSRRSASSDAVDVFLSPAPDDGDHRPPDVENGIYLQDSTPVVIPRQEDKPISTNGSISKNKLPTLPKPAERNRRITLDLSRLETGLSTGDVLPSTGLPPWIQEVEARRQNKPASPSSLPKPAKLLTAGEIPPWKKEFLEIKKHRKDSATSEVIMSLPSSAVPLVSVSRGSVPPWKQEVQARALQRRSSREASRNGSLDDGTGTPALPPVNSEWARVAAERRRTRLVCTGLSGLQLRRDAS